jgi:hypothetical protein
MGWASNKQKRVGAAGGQSARLVPVTQLRLAVWLLHVAVVVRMFALVGPDAETGVFMLAALPA